VLSSEEVRRVIALLNGVPQLVGKLIYGSRLRLMEALRLRLKDVDFKLLSVTVRGGKGGKDRVTTLAVNLAGPLQEHLERVRVQFEADRREGLAGSFVPRGSRVKGFASRDFGIGLSRVLRLCSPVGNGCRLVHRVFDRFASANPRASGGKIVCHFVSRAVAIDLLRGLLGGGRCAGAREVSEEWRRAAVLEGAAQTPSKKISAPATT
jgi:hypothetical protein